MVERSDRMWSTGERNGKPLQYFCLENPMNSMKRQKDSTLKDELPRLVGAHTASILLFHESRQIGSGQIGNGKSEHRHSRNQQTKMDWNG